MIIQEAGLRNKKTKCFLELLCSKTILNVDNFKYTNKYKINSFVVLGNRKSF